MSETTQAPLLTPEHQAADHKDYALPGGVVIKFQKGALALGRNGVTTEEIIEVVLDHLRGFQKGPFACRENALAITNFEQGLLWVRERKRLREEQGVKGRDAAHASAV